MAWSYMIGPLIGAVIGYFTNYIAVRMLFYPKKEIRIMGHKLPFTPGAIPKGKDRLARVIGTVIGNTLLTKEDIEEKLLSEEISGKIIAAAAENFHRPLKYEIMELTGVPEYTYQERKDFLIAALSEEIARSVSQLDFESIIMEKGSELLKERVQGTMLKMFLSDDTLASITEKIGTEVQTVIVSLDVEFYQPTVKEKVDDLEMKTGAQLLERGGIDGEQLEKLIGTIYQRGLKAGIGKLMDTIDISHIVEEKIEDMSIDDLEDMVLKVMKRELNTIVNLGALIGFLLGLVNLLF